MTCEHLKDGNCRVAEALALVPCPANADSCRACVEQPLPQAPNLVTKGLARMRLRSLGMPHEHLYPKEVADQINTVRERRSVTINVRGKPGSSLKLILHRAQVFGDEGCLCDDYAKLMDLWGVSVCQERIDQIVAHLNSQNVSWFDMLRVAAAGYLTTRSLVQAAIDKARE